jgi:hypothetical protein
MTSNAQKVTMNLKNLSYFLILVLSVSCGSSESSSNSDNPDSIDNNSNTNNTNIEEPILTEKLVGTPFEGFTIGDDFTECTFTVNEFFTETVSEDDLPIPVFAAFFTGSEEEAIQEAIEIANDAMRSIDDDPNTGIEEDVLVLVSEWVDHARVIIKVENTFGDGATINTIGQARTFGFREIAGRTQSTTYTTDWEIRLIKDIPTEDLTKITAHELGHALGIIGHQRINYFDNSLTELEENSIMLASNPGFQLNDYRYMMRNQAENLKRNFDQTSDLKSGTCILDGEFGDTL